MTYHLPVLPPALSPPPESFKPRESFSPSQLAAFAGEGGCKRKWALRSLWGVSETRKSIATVLGTLIHACLEHYMKGRTVYDLVAPDGTLRIGEKELKEVTTIEPDKLKKLVDEAPKRALAGLHFLPNINDPALEVREMERWINVDTTKIIGGVKPIKINGKIDLSIRRVGIWYLYDHKSTKGKPPQKGMPANPWVYVKTPEQLQKDPQSVFYSLDIMLRHNLDALWCRWVYYLTDTKAHPQATCVDVELRRDDMLKAAYEWLLVAVEMRELVHAAIAGTLSLDDIPPPAILPPDERSPCLSYGGCPYSIDRGGPCAPAGEVQLGAILLTSNNKTKKDDQEMSLTDAYNNAQAALGNPTGPMLPPGNPLVPPEAAAAPQQVPPGFEMGPSGLRPLAPAGFRYNAAGTALEPLPPPAPVAPPAPPPLPPAAAAVAHPPIQTSISPAVAQASAAPYAAPPPIPEAPAPDAAAKGKGRGKAKKSADDVIDLIFAAAKNGNAVIATLTVSQVEAIREIVEAA